MKTKAKEILEKNKIRTIDWEGVYRRIDAAGGSFKEDLSPEDKGRVLRQRAAKLASPPRPQAQEDFIEVVEFVLAFERYAFESSYVKEICPLNELTPVPCTPPFVLGMINLRGSILSVIDIKKFFDLPEKGLTDLNKVIILSSVEMEFGVLADSITGVSNIPSACLSTGLPTLGGIREDYLKGVTPDRLTVLDAGKLLGDRGIVVNENE